MGAGLVDDGGEIAREDVVALVAAVAVRVCPGRAERVPVVRRGGCRGLGRDLGEELADRGGIDGGAGDEAVLSQLVSDPGSGADGEAAGGCVPGGVVDSGDERDGDAGGG